VQGLTKICSHLRKLIVMWVINLALVCHDKGIM
jgi:hypothetical protein